jgi:hypothetical protein
MAYLPPVNRSRLDLKLDLNPHLAKNLQTYETQAEGLDLALPRPVHVADVADIACIFRAALHENSHGG